MIRAIDHIVILVADLAAASADYAALGFTVTPGGEHTGGQTGPEARPNGRNANVVAFTPMCSVSPDCTVTTAHGCTCRNRANRSRP